MLTYVGWPLLALVAWDVMMVLAYNLLHWEWVGSKNIPLALYGSVIGLIVGFRNNSAYARWWESRGLWGQIVNNSRSLGRQVQVTTHPVRAADDDLEQLHLTQRRLIYHQIAFVHALGQHLRGLSPWEAIRGLLSSDEFAVLQEAKNAPLAIQQEIGRMLRQAKDQGWIDSREWQAMDGNLDDLADAQGGTERIKNTPMPKQYDYFPSSLC